jgi:hypothetical protein
MMALKIYREPRVAMIGGTRNRLHSMPFHMPKAAPTPKPIGTTSKSGRPAW